MDSVKVMYELPVELVERAQALGLDLTQETSGLINLIQERIRKAEALRKFDEIAAKIDALPTDIKPTPDEIVAEIRAYRAEQAAKKA